MIDELIADYLLALQARGCTAHTLRWYRQSLRQFAAWLRETGSPPDPAAWTPTLLRSYICYHQTRTTARGTPVSAHQVADLVSAVRTFCRWLQAEGIVGRDLFARVPVPARPRLVKPVLTPAQIEQLLATVRRQRRNALRDEAILLLLLDTGIRASELCGLRPEHIDWTSRVARVFGKGQKERYVPFSTITAQAMRRYARVRPDGPTFFLSKGGRPLTVSGLDQLCRRLAERSGVHLTPHMCRHTFSIEYLRRGGSAFALQKTLGHTTLDVTLRYVALVTDDLVREHQEHSPVYHLLGRGRRAGVPSDR